MELSDKELLASFDRNMGRAIEIDGRRYSRKSGQTPARFLDEVRREHIAWKASQEAAEDRRRRDAEDLRNTRAEQARADQPSVQPAVQQSQGSLEETLKSQVSGLRTRYENKLLLTKRLSEQLEVAGIEAAQVYKELRLAEKFLREIQDGVNASEVCAPVGADIPGEGEGGKGRGDRVGEPSGSPSLCDASEERD